ncbi:MAG: LptF/LptG family permease [Nitrospinae bacterium]|jgi:lipopolysaccharide export system permease protein|nr:LptF/LptG family permease [Nitrospinota bacterium]
MKILDRYIIGELLKVFFISMGAITGVLYLDKFLLMAEMLVRWGVGILDMLRLIVYLAPAYLAVTIPMSVLVATVVVFNHFSSTNEWTAMKVGKWSFFRLLGPGVIFACTAYFISSAIIFVALPWGNQSYKDLIHTLTINHTPINIKPNVFNRDLNNLTLYVKEKEKDSHFKGIFISNMRKPDAQQIISAEEGFLIKSPDASKIHFQLKKGTIHEVNRSVGNYQTINFDGYDLIMDVPAPVKTTAYVADRELSPGELIERIKLFKRQGLKASGPAVELSKKFSIPFACLVFALLGIPLGIQSGDSGKSGGLAICLGIVLAYYFCLISSQNLGMLGTLNPYLSVWIHNIVALLPAIYLTYKMQNETGILQKLIRH